MDWKSSAKFSLERSVLYDLRYFSFWTASDHCIYLTPAQTLDTLSDWVIDKTQFHRVLKTVVARCRHKERSKFAMGRVSEYSWNFTSLLAQPLPIDVGMWQGSWTQGNCSIQLHIQRAPLCSNPYLDRIQGRSDIKNTSSLSSVTVSKAFPKRDCDRFHLGTIGIRYIVDESSVDIGLSINESMGTICVRQHRH